MGEKKFTLLELHLDGDTQIGPGSLAEMLGSSAFEEETEGVGTSPHASATADDEADESGRRLFPLVAGTIAMIAIAVAVRRYRREDEVESIEERDVVVN